MVLLDSFSITWQPYTATPYTEKSKIFDCFSATIAHDFTTPITAKSKIFDAFSATIANYADTLTYRDPFGLITHKKK
jgi:hypothetical protein